MAKVKTLEDLRRLRDELKSNIHTREKGIDPEKMVQVKISMATCGIAAGAKEIMAFFIHEFDQRAIDAIVTQTGCMGYCYAEPTVEITLPGQEAVVFGFVTEKKASEIIDKYIIQGQLVDGIIPVTYRSVND